MKNKPFAQRLILPLVALLTFVFAGCASNVQVAPADASLGGPVGSDAYSATSRASQLQISVSAMAADTKDRDLAGSVETQVQGKLNQQGLQVTPQGGDLSVGITVSSALFDQSGNYYRWEGTADTSIRRNVDLSTVESKLINVRASRKLGEAAARDVLVAELSRETADWVAGNMGDKSLQLSANDIQIKVPFYKNAASYTKTFIREVRQVPGVANVMLVQQDSAQKLLTFRVVYFQNKIPEGILYRIARIDELNIRL